MSKMKNKCATCGRKETKWDRCMTANCIHQDLITETLTYTDLKNAYQKDINEGKFESNIKDDVVDNRYYGDMGSLYGQYYCD